MLRRLAWPVLGVLAGLLFLALLAQAEARWLAQQPWHGAALDLSAPPATDDAYALAVRTLPGSLYPQEEALFRELEHVPDLKGLYEAFQTFDAEWLVALDAPPEVFAGLLGTGRVPEPGTGEVLAGPLARLDTFALDGQRFEVVGRLRPGTYGFAFAYLLPEHPRWRPVFQAEHGGRTGHVVPDRHSNEESHLAFHEREIDADFWRERLVPTHTAFSWATVGLLLLVAVCGAMAQIRLITGLAGRLPRMLDPLAQAMCAWPKLLYGVHAFLLGLFFIAMLLAMREPVWNARFLAFINYEFSDGGLAYVGRAHETGNPLLFAAAIFANNFGVQTFGLTFLASLPPLALGFVKTALTFALVGFIMAPVWVGCAEGYWFHALTLTLEFEPYILACFAVLLWPIHLLRAAQGASGERLAEIKTGARIFGSAIVWCAILLAIAAFYEAVTLLLFR